MAKTVTKNYYAYDFLRFKNWAKENKKGSPKSVVTVISYLEALMDRGCTKATMQRQMTAIKYGMKQFYKTVPNLQEASVFLSEVA